MRVITQKVASNWEVTGKLVKVAGKIFFITNAAQKLLTLENAMQEATITRANTETLNASIIKFAFLQLNSLKKEKKNIIGFNTGITDKRDIWIIGGNYIPDLTMFNMLEDQQMYTTILSAKKK